MTTAKTTDIIFCGNPGVGKSSIASSISGIQFESGISFGSGLTVKLQWNISPKLPNVRFADTPGLADMELKEAAATAITQALKEGATAGHDTKIIFVVTTEGARLRPDDLYTIKVVMGSIRNAAGETPGMNSYAVIINKCEFLGHPSFHKGGQEKIESMLTNPNLNVIPTAHIKFLPVTDALTGQDNAMVAFEGLLEWVLMRTPKIQVAEAEKIDTSSQEEAIEAMKQEHKAAMERLESLTEQQTRELAAAQEARQDLERTMEEERAAMEEKARQMQRQVEEDRRKAQQQMEEDRQKAQEQMDTANKQMQEQMDAQRRQMQQQIQATEDRAAASGGGLMGAFVDLSTLISKPIAQAASGKSGSEFEREWNRALGTVKRFCVI